MSCHDCRSACPCSAQVCCCGLVVVRFLDITYFEEILMKLEEVALEIKHRYYASHVEMIP